ncbi:MAG: hypothetical protein JWR59_1978 [Brevundimonas sp.]|nr:hypothetical protein [Brevundimonas sp.]
MTRSTAKPLKAALWNNSLSSVLASLFLISLFGQAALRERGSPESKPVSAPHNQTGSA